MSKKAGQKLIFGLAINDTEEPICSTRGGVRWWCPKYVRWYDMLRRTIGNSPAIKNKSYSETELSEEWLRFSIFRDWMETQNFKDNHLDKDVFGQGCLYSEESCCFIPPAVNSFILGINSSADRAYGVSFMKGCSKYRAQVVYKQNKILDQLYESKYEARLSYLNVKIGIFDKVTEEYQLEDRIADAIIQKYQKAYNEAVLLSLKGE